MSSFIDTEMTRKNIFIENSDSYPAFFNEVQADLAQLEATAIGRRLIEKIGNLTKVYILHGDCSFTHSGVNLRIYYKGDRSTSNYFTSDLTIAQKPSWIDLAHELIHAYHHMKGKSAPDLGRADGMVWNNDEEYHTIMGFPSKKATRTTPKITENALLAESKLPERFSHFSTSDRSNTTPIFLRRLELSAKIYREQCQAIGFTSQAQSQPPPIINCTAENLAPSNYFVLYYSCFNPETKKKLSVFKDASHLSADFPEDFVRSQFPPKDCRPELQLHKFFPNQSHQHVLNMGIFRVSLLEAEELDAMGRKTLP